MKVTELDREEKIELKQRVLIERCEGTSETPSWGELANADLIVSDSELESVYEDTDFSKDDFFCNTKEVPSDIKRGRKCV